MAYAFVNFCWTSRMEACLRSLRGYGVQNSDPLNVVIAKDQGPGAKLGSSKFDARPNGQQIGKQSRNWVIYSRSRRDCNFGDQTTRTFLWVWCIVLRIAVSNFKGRIVLHHLFADVICPNPKRFPQMGVSRKVPKTRSYLWCLEGLPKDPKRYSSIIHY